MKNSFNTAMCYHNALIYHRENDSWNSLTQLLPIFGKFQGMCWLKEGLVSMGDIERQERTLADKFIDSRTAGTMVRLAKPSLPVEKAHQATPTY